MPLGAPCYKRAGIRRYGCGVACMALLEGAASAAERVTIVRGIVEGAGRGAQPSQHLLAL